MEWNFEGYIDRYGMPVLYTLRSIVGVDGEEIYQGAISYWDNEVDSLGADLTLLMSSKTVSFGKSHAFRDESKASIFNLTKIYQQLLQ